MTSAFTTNDVSVTWVLKAHVWEGRATTQACFSDARMANCLSVISDDVVGDTRLLG